MSDSREPSHPPSAPLPTGRRGFVVPEDRFSAALPRPDRVQVLAALLLGLVLVVIGLYVWRHPHESSEAAASGDSLPLASASPLAPGPPSMADAGPPSPVVVSDARVLGCHDRGPKKTPADECDHLAPIEQALATAIEQAALCVRQAPNGTPGAASGGTIEYVADVSFAKQKVSLSLPRVGRSVNDRKVLGACATAVRVALRPVPLEGIHHEHARYKIAVTATYRGSASGV